MSEHETFPGEDDEESVVRRELRDAAEQVAAVRSNERKARANIRGEKETHMSVLRHLEEAGHEILESRHQDRERRLAELRHQLETYLQSGQNEKVAELLEEIARLEL